jgi:hypothetical protein
MLKQLNPRLTRLATIRQLKVPPTAAREILSCSEMADEGHNPASNATTSGDHSPATSASHSGTGDINIDQSVHYSPSTEITYKGERLLGKSIGDLLASIHR